MRVNEATHTNIAFEKLMEVATKYLPGGKVVRPMPVEVELELSEFTKEDDKVEKYVLDGTHKFVAYDGKSYYVQMESVLAIFGFEMMRPLYYIDSNGDTHEIHTTKYDHIVLQVYDGEKWVDAVTVYRGRGEQLNAVVNNDVNDISIVDEFGQNIVLVALQPNTQFRIVVMFEEDSDILNWIDNSDFKNDGGKISVVYHGLAVTYDYNDYLPKQVKEVTEQAVGGVIGELFMY